jgi:hypothetical protein
MNKVQTVGDLLAELDGIDPATPIRIAVQPSRRRVPFQNEVGAVTVAGNGPGAFDTVYLAAGEEVDILRLDVTEELGW